MSVRCKPLAAKVDQACGLLFRYRDEHNYDITRANVLEKNVRLYYVENGKRQQIATWSGEVVAERWSELPDAGKVGVWTKADSVTAFDLSVAPAK